MQTSKDRRENQTTSMIITSIRPKDKPGENEWAPLAAGACCVIPKESERPKPGSEDVAVDFLEKLRPGGPWVPTAIEPDGKTKIKTITAQTTDEVRKFVRDNNGKRNLYYSVNPTRKAMTKKAAKTDISAVEFVLADLDPAEGESPAAAKERYLTKLETFEPRPTAIVNSGNGIQALWRLKEPIILGEPRPNAQGEAEFSDEDKTTIAEVEARVAEVMLRLGAKPGTQNIDRILRLPGTINLPNAKKRREGRVECPAELIEFNERAYALEAFPPPAPRQQKAKKSKAGSKVVASDIINDLRVSQRIKDLIRGLDDQSHPYDSRSEAVMAVLVAMAREGHSDEEMRAVMAGEIGQHIRDQPKPEAYLERQIVRARELATDPDVAKVNKDHALVIVGDKTMILKELPHGDIQFLTHSAFENWHRNQYVKCVDKKTTLARYWMSHPQRRQYEGLVFAPGREVPGHYNLWKGFAVEPRPGECSKFLAHVRDNVCRGDHKLFDWVIGWFAQIVQHPEKKVGTALVLRGKQGTGKTKVGQVFGSLLGSHYAPVADPRYITGRFNSHLAPCLLLHADEGFWAGDHAAEGKLKDLITGDHHFIEYKGKEPIKVRNYTRLLVTGNPDWLVPAGYEERRFAVLDVGEDHMQDHAYFQAIDEEMENGGREALLDLLLRFDLSNVNLRAIPKTSALFEQKLASFTGEQSWWYELLVTGVLPGGCDIGRCCPAQALHDSYIEHANRTGIKRRDAPTRLGIFLKKQVPNLRKPKKKYRVRRLGSYVEHETRGAVYEFPPLADCRAAFEKMTQQEIEWPEQHDWIIEGQERDNIENPIADHALLRSVDELFKRPDLPFSAPGAACFETHF